jgi:hypothetical protein
VRTTVVFADQGGQDTDEHVLLDLSPARLDRLYAAFWDTFGVAGSMPVVAHSVAGALMWLVGEQVTSSSDVLGDAYD